jgi:hypothetical protein
MTDTPSLEIPAQLRELAEKNVEQARAAYGQFMDFFTQTISAWPKTPANPMTSGFGAVQRRAIAFATENAESAFAVAIEFAAAKDIKDVLTVQSRYAQTQLQSFARQAQELGKLMTDTMRAAQGVIPSYDADGLHGVDVQASAREASETEENQASAKGKSHRPAALGRKSGLGESSVAPELFDLCRGQPGDVLSRKVFDADFGRLCLGVLELRLRDPLNRWGVGLALYRGPAW